MSSQSYPTSDLNAWLAQVLRLTAFPVDPEAALKQDLWEEVMGEPSETSTRKKLLRTDEGRIDSKVLTLTIDLKRIEWAFYPEIDPLNLPAEIPSLGAFTAAIDECSDFIRRFFSGHCPEIQRLAFGAQLVRPSESREGAYRILDSCLQDVKVDQNSHDFLYRINKKRKCLSLAHGPEINRLSTWSAIKLQFGTIVQGSEPLSPLHPTEWEGCRLELDINTDANRKEPLPGESLLEIWQELVDLGKEIAERGDVT